MITEKQIHDAVKQLCRSERGRKACVDLYEMLHDGASALDSMNQAALTLLFTAGISEMPSTVMEVLGEVEE